MDRSARAFGISMVLLSCYEPAPCAAQSLASSKAAPTASLPDLLPPLKPLTDPLAEPQPESAGGELDRCAPPRHAGHHQTETRRRAPLSDLAFADGDIIPCPGVAFGSDDQGAAPSPTVAFAGGRFGEVSVPLLVLSDGNRPPYRRSRSTPDQTESDAGDHNAGIA